MSSDLQIQYSNKEKKPWQIHTLCQLAKSPTFTKMEIWMFILSSNEFFAGMMDKNQN